MRDKIINQVITQTAGLQHETVASINNSSAELSTNLINYFEEHLLGYVIDQLLYHFFADLHEQHHNAK